MTLLKISVVALCVSGAFSCFRRSNRRIIEGESPGIYIPLAEDLEPRSVGGEQRWNQSQLLENWTRYNPVAKGKKFKLGSKEMVSAGEDKGLFSTILASYNNHWVLRTRPEDWWSSVSQIIATRIDKEAKHPSVREFFVSHEGKKTLTVKIGPTVHGIDNESFFQQMIYLISQNINKPEYTTIMQSDFSQSTSVDRVVNSIMLMYSFQEYFEYRVMMLCGIPGVSMMGSEEDWERLVVKLEEVEEFLKPLDDVLQLADWFNSSKVVLRNLLETYRGYPDKDWWSRIMNLEQEFGSGGGTTVSGWFVTSFLGLKTGDLEDVPSGVNVVPLTLTGVSMM